ncbi:hypothetical protein DV736_g6199, partial [Chaetothyriales sp. CBS 134916]
MRIYIRVGLSIVLAVTIPLLLALHFTFHGGDQPASLIAYPTDLQEILKSSTAPAIQPFHPPLHTEGRFIVDANNTRFKLISVNWYGASDELFVVGGLNIRNRKYIAQIIRQLGFNSVRLPYSDELVRKNPIVSSHLLSANPDLVGLRALSIFAEVVNTLTDAGLAVIINDHITQARWCCDANLCDGQWYNDYLGPLCPVRQTMEDWIQNLETVMKPHVTNPLVVGVDLRNEVRGVADRFLWNSWVTAAEAAAERLHSLQPEWLMIVEGVSSANILSGIHDRPVRITQPHKLVYSAHVYGWSGWGTLRPYWKRTYASFAADMDKHWAFLLDEALTPVWIGEFGAPNIPAQRDLNYWKNLIRYLGEKDIDFGYWAINPRKPHDNAEESYGLLNDDWVTPRYDYRLYDMWSIAASRGDDGKEL